jgi:hypothetical protein
MIIPDHLIIVRRCVSADDCHTQCQAVGAFDDVHHDRLAHKGKAPDHSEALRTEGVHPPFSQRHPNSLVQYWLQAHLRGFRYSRVDQRDGARVIASLVFEQIVFLLKINLRDRNCTGGVGYAYFSALPSGDYPA